MSIFRPIVALAFAAVSAIAVTPIAWAQSPTHIALIIANSSYSTGQLATPRANADIVAETMRAAGYDVTEVNDVNGADIGEVMREFLDKVAAAGPNAVAFFYYCGLAAQASSENYLVPVDARIGGIDDVSVQALRLNDLTDALAQLPAAARIVVLDASRDTGYGRGTSGLVAPGLAIMQVPTGSLVGFAAAPDQIAVQTGAQYDLYTATLVSLMRQPGLDLNQIFETARAQVNQFSGGHQIPWTALGLTVQVTLFPAPAGAMAPGSAVPVPQGVVVTNLVNAPPAAKLPPRGERTVTKGMLSQLAPDDAYMIAIQEDSLEVYQWFVELFPQHQYAAQIWDLINSRRDELLWQRAVTVNTRDAYWNYLDRYPNGIHANEAQQALASMREARRPPPSYRPQPIQLPAGYYDEAQGVPELIQSGLPAPAPVFGDIPPDYAAAPPEQPPFDIGTLVDTLSSLVPQPSPPAVDNPPPVESGPGGGPGGSGGGRGPGGGPGGGPGAGPGHGPGGEHGARHSGVLQPVSDHQPQPTTTHEPKNAGVKKLTPTNKTPPKIPTKSTKPTATTTPGAGTHRPGEGGALTTTPGAGEHRPGEGGAPTTTPGAGEHRPGEGGAPTTTPGAGEHRPGGAGPSIPPTPGAGGGRPGEGAAPTTTPGAGEHRTGPSIPPTPGAGAGAGEHRTGPSIPPTPGAGAGAGAPGAGAAAGEHRTGPSIPPTPGAGGGQPSGAGPSIAPTPGAGGGRPGGATLPPPPSPSGAPSAAGGRSGTGAPPPPPSTSGTHPISPTPPAGPPKGLPPTDERGQAKPQPTKPSQLPSQVQHRQTPAAMPHAAPSAPVHTQAPHPVAPSRGTGGGFGGRRR